MPSPRQQRTIVARRYTIRRRLGSGSLGTVYLAYDDVTRRDVALKVIHSDRVSPAAVTRMQDEFRAIASLNHPQIASAFDFGYAEDGRAPYYTREYIAGDPLPPGPPSDGPVKTLRPILDLLDALHYIHGNGILHLDIHAGNLIVADDEERGSVLIDFGIVGSFEKTRFSTRSGEWFAMPPELLENGALTERTDLFLVGRLLLYRLTGRPDEEPRLPGEIPGWGTRLTLDVERITAKALQRSPGQRFASAVEFRAALSAALGEGTASVHTAEPQDVLVGRDAELATIEESLRHATNGAAEILWFVGRGEIGKSRLLVDVRLNAQLRGLHAVFVSFYPDRDPEETLVHAFRSLKTSSGGEDSWLEPLSPRHGGTPRERAVRASEAYFGEAGPPLVLLLDDIDRADHESWTLAQALISECLLRRQRGSLTRGIAIIATSSRPPKQSFDRGIVRQLKPLAADAAAQLFRTALRPLVPSATLTKKAIAAARGSPLHIRQLARELHDQWRPTGSIPPAAELPRCEPRPSPLSALESSKLSADEREVLSTLAIVGRAARVDELAQAVGRTTQSVARSLRRLVAAELVFVHGRGSSRRFQLNLQGSPNDS